MTALTTLVNTPCGALEGKKDKSSLEHEYISFLGIPYASDAKRFEEATPITKWAGTMVAKTYGSDCMQYDMFQKTVTGIEDALYINVFTRAKQQEDTLPVVVLIHGGGFTIGSGDDKGFGPCHAMNEEMVFVTINYRLGLLGFMPPFDESIPANLGLKDMRLALQWVKKNIASFGGDPNNVTLMGESAGGAAVWYQYLDENNQEEELFHKVFTQSGAPLSPWANFADYQECFANYVDKVFEGTKVPADQLVGKIKSVPPEKLLMVAEEYKDENPAGPYPFRPFFPPGRLYDKMKQDSLKTKDIPTMVQLNETEGTVFLLSQKSHATIYERTMQEAKTDPKTVWKLYKGPDSGPKPEFGASEAHDKVLTRIYSDLFFDAPVCMGVELHQQKNSTYLLKYVHRGQMKLLNVFSGGKLNDESAGHGDDVFLMFGSSAIPQPPFDPKSQDGMACLHLWWMVKEFATSGIAKFKDVNGQVHDIPKATPDKEVYLEFSTTPALKTGFKPEHFDFWKNAQMSSE